MQTNHTAPCTSGGLVQTYRAASCTPGGWWLTYREHEDERPAPARGWC